jgi:serine/threonine-protein kinase
MSSILIPQKIIDDYTQGFYECPYCRGKLQISDHAELDPAPCMHCQKTIMAPHKVGAFWLFQQIGKGAMGCVYKAFHEHHHRSIYAVKMLHRKEKGNERLIRALQREASVTARFSCHPHIINFITHGWDREEYYLVTEYIQGETLLKRIERAGKLTELESLRIISEIISAENYIYADGYLFRDLKPENVMLENDTNRSYLFDFGLSLPLVVAEMDQGQFLEASPIYVPPERLTGEGEGITSEIYSLGMILYYAVTGQPYFTTAQEIQGLLKRHMSQFRLSGAVTKMGTLSKDLADVITHMIKREPEERFPDMETLEFAVESLIQARQNT